MASSGLVEGSRLHAHHTLPYLRQVLQQLPLRVLARALHAVVHAQPACAAQLGWDLGARRHGGGDCAFRGQAGHDIGEKSIMLAAA